MSTKVGDTIKFSSTKRTKSGFEITAHSGVVTELRTVEQALVVQNGKKHASWVDLPEGA